MKKRTNNKQVLTTKNKIKDKKYQKIVKKYINFLKIMQNLAKNLSFLTKNYILFVWQKEKAKFKNQPHPNLFG